MGKIVSKNISDQGASKMEKKILFALMSKNIYYVKETCRTYKFINVDTQDVIIVKNIVI